MADDGDDNTISKLLNVGFNLAADPILKDNSR